MTHQCTPVLLIGLLSCSWLIWCCVSHSDCVKYSLPMHLCWPVGFLPLPAHDACIQWEPTSRRTIMIFWDGSCMWNPFPPWFMHKSPLLHLKRSPQISIHINAYPCDGIRDLAEDVPGLRRRVERWELNVRSNGGYKGETDGAPPPAPSASSPGNWGICRTPVWMLMGSHCRSVCRAQLNQLHLHKNVESSCA